MNTKDFILQQYKTYPALQPTDLCKALYQSVFGCGHLIGDPSAAAGYIRREASFAVPNPVQLEPLDGDYCRVYLSILDTGLSADTFAKLFAYSAEKGNGSIEQLKQKLSVVSECIDALPFTKEAWNDAVFTWEAAGFPACHHSEIYREHYHPAYRLLHKDFIPFLPLFAAIDRAMEQPQPFNVAIEGGSASGKSTLADLLAKLYDCNNIHMDDFFLQPYQRTEARLSEIGGNIDYERFGEEITPTIRINSNILYRKFDCSVMALGETVSLPAKKLTIVEGAYSTHPYFKDPYQLRVFLKIDPQLQKQRIQKRNTPDFQQRFFEIWIPMEERYFEATSIQNRCDLVLEVNA